MIALEPFRGHKVLASLEQEAERFIGGFFVQRLPRFHPMELSEEEPSDGRS